jgi:glycosyltransferase involved in cell wall biosynthesis
MNILELCLSPDFGGLEIHIKDYCSWLEEQTDITLFLALREDSRLFRALSQSKSITITFRSRMKSFPIIKAIKLAQFLRDHSIDVIHVHWKNDLPLAALTKWLSNKGIRFVYTRHMSLPGKKYDIYHKLIYGRMDYFIATTRRIADQAKQNLPIDSSKIRQIYLGINAPATISEREKKELKKKFDLGDVFTIGLFGRISEFKGHHLLISAIEKLKEEGLRLRALIVGHAMEGAYLKYLKQELVNKKLEEDIKFTGFYEQPTALMQCIDVLVLTTRRETFGLVMVEGMYVGVPVVGSNAGGVPEIIDHNVNGLLFEPDNIEALAGSIRRLYHDEQLRLRLALEGKKKARLHFNAENQFNTVKNCLIGK